MRIMFDLLSEPIRIKDDQISVLCIENKEYYRKFIKSLCSDYPEEDKIIFSQEYKPIKFKNNIRLIRDYYSLEFTTSFYKKIYEQMSDFCVNEIMDATIEMKKVVLLYIDKIIENYDFDFQSNDDVILSDLFKIQGLKPNFDKMDSLESLLDFILIYQKYAPVKLFVFVGLHNDYSKQEIELFYHEMLSRKIPLMVLESNTNFTKSLVEDITIIDEDLCVIIENK